jgi:sugar phosphate isomerase/epimerase
LCVAGIDECLEYAATKGVFLALENHGGITATPAQLIAIIKRIKPSEWFGVNYDSGNFRTDDPYADLEQIAPYAINAQIKVTVTAKGQKQPADLKRMVDILKQANYRGYVVLEYEEREPLKEIPEYIHKLRELIG